MSNARQEPSDPLVGYCTFELHLPGSQSLKQKRGPIKSLKDMIRNRFNVSVGEFGYRNLWQRATLAVSIVADHEDPMRQVFDHIRGMIDMRGDMTVVDWHVEFFQGFQ